MRYTLTVNESADLVIRDYHIVIPSTQKRVVELAHEGHQGMSKTKERTEVWFPGIDAAVEESVKRCIPCQAVHGWNSVSTSAAFYTYGRVPVGDNG